VLPSLADATLGFRVTNFRYRKVAEVSENLASRDLKVLVNQKLLVPKGERRGRYYERSILLKGFLDNSKESSAIPDPFKSSTSFAPGRAAR
jgi:hypothetical protein